MKFAKSILMKKILDIQASEKLNSDEKRTLINILLTALENDYNKIFLIQLLTEYNRLITHLGFDELLLTEDEIDKLVS
ncbi:MAG: hypothetical protein QXS19_05850 [Candidatus Methanomethylicia archaeon]